MELAAEEDGEAANHTEAVASVEDLAAVALDMVDVMEDLGDAVVDGVVAEAMEATVDAEVVVDTVDAALSIRSMLPRPTPIVTILTALTYAERTSATLVLVQTCVKALVKEFAQTILMSATE